MIIALAGNQNCGKTTLFNRLTASRQHVANWPGVTVERKMEPLSAAWAQLLGQPAQVVDLPGVYSLNAFSQDEAVTGRFLLEGNPDVIVNVVDASHLERNLYLTLEIMQLGIPMVIALNMMDCLQARGGSVDVPALSQALGVPVVPVCAKGGQGMQQLLRALLSAQKPDGAFRCCGKAGETLQALALLVRRHEPQQTMPERKAAFLLEGGASMPAGDAAREVQSLLWQLEASSGLPAGAALAAGRYRYLEKLLRRCYSPGVASGTWERADRLLAGSPVAIPLFVLMVAAVFWLAFGLPGRLLSTALSALLERCGTAAGAALARAGLAPWLRGLVMDGIFQGLTAVAGFLPPLLLMMLLLDLMEDSGYLARAAFLMDRPLRAVGLGGRSLIPMVMGFGCTVPAVLCARGIRSSRERRLVILLAPLMSCSAKLPVYGLLAQAFFPECAALVVFSLYLAGIAMGALLGWLTSRRSREEAPFLLELPPLRRPSLGNALRQTGKRLREFMSRMFSLVILSTIGVWLLSSLTPAFGWTQQLEESLLGRLAGVLSPLLAPCGFGSAAAAAALLTGLLAKESIVSTLAVLAGMQAGGMQGLFASPLAACAFLLFVLLYTPCVAACAAMRQELGSSGTARLAEVCRLLLAWSVSAIVYQAGCLLGLG